MKNKKATINPINKKDNKCFQYAVTVTLNHKKIGKYPGKITKIKPFMYKHNSEEIIFDQKKIIGKKLKK